MKIARRELQPRLKPQGELFSAGVSPLVGWVGRSTLHQHPLVGRVGGPWSSRGMLCSDVEGDLRRSSDRWHE